MPRDRVTSHEPDISELERHRREVGTPSGPASYLDTGGDGPPVVLVHGVGTGSYLWRHVLRALAGERRCIAVDLPLHGRTPAAPQQDFTLTGLARFVADLCDALRLRGVDLVANDTGGAACQIVAATRPDLLHTLVLTDCETRGNVPPRAFRSTVLAARTGFLARSAPRLLRDLPAARRRIFGSGYQDVEALPLGIARAFLWPVLGTRPAARQFQRFILSLHDRDLRAVDAQLRRSTVPTAIVWGTDDVFFPLGHAERLAAVLPRAGEVVRIEGGRLFLPDERADELTAELRRHWAANGR